MNDLSELEEENRRLKAENELSKKLIEKSLRYFDKLDRWDANADDKPKEEARDTRYDALLEEMRMNDEMLGIETTKVTNKIPPMYQKLLEELRENDELLNNTIK